MVSEVDIERWLTVPFDGDGDGDGSGYGYGYGDGYGSGYGDGDGDGSGSGYGYGYGYGYGDGSGSGYGYGDGSGSGSGYGSGYGDGDGDGDGDGSGSGYGDGDGSGFKSINGERVWYIDSVPTVIRSLRGAIAQGAILDYRTMELKPCYVAKIGSSFAHGETLREAVADAQGKEMERVPLEQRVANFLSHHPSLDSTASGHYLYQWHHILTGSCKMGRDEFIRTRGLELDRIYTIREFIDLTKDAYGSAQIRQLAKAYNYEI